MEIDFAILACGALTVPIYPSNLADECGYIIATSGSSVVCVETESSSPRPTRCDATGSSWTASASG